MRKDAEKAKWYSFLREHAPTMSLEDAGTLVDAFADTHENMMIYGEALAVLFETSALAYEKEEHHAAAAQAIKVASERHAWVVCGPDGAAMPRLLQEWEKRR